ncbi:MAG: winged helix-turn-helix transcriptional regulator [Hyphomicrobiaceae bacterium]|nr:winged helix-turn-helix transcriptional regulator [Hyphomicrobiaceae bacterium]
MLVSARKTTDFLKSLSHPMRLVILCRLAEGGARVNELESMLDMPQAAVSKQLSRLRDEELVKATRQGRFMVYELADDRARRIVLTLYEEFCGVK